MVLADLRGDDSIVRLELREVALRAIGNRRITGRARGARRDVERGQVLRIFRERRVGIGERLLVIALAELARRLLGERVRVRLRGCGLRRRGGARRGLVEVGAASGRTLSASSCAVFALVQSWRFA